MRHRDELRSVKTKENHAGRKLRSIQHAGLMNAREHNHAILATVPTYLALRNGIFNQICDI
jgi:hypothetical protein